MRRFCRSISRTTPHAATRRSLSASAGCKSAVYATEVSDEEYLAFTTEQTEKMEVYALAEKLDGDIEAAIRQLAERRRREREA